MRFLYKWYTKITLACVILLFLGRALYRNFSVLQGYDWNINWEYFPIAVLLVIINFVFLSLIWRSTIKYFSGKRLSLRKTFYIWGLSSLGKYIPGKVWAVAGMIVMVEKEGISRSDGIVSALTYQYLNISAGFVLTVIGAVIYFKEWLTPALVILGIPMMIALIYPPVISAVLNFGFKMFKFDERCDAIDFRKALIYLFCHMICWTIYGLAFYFFIKSISNASFFMIFALTAVFASSYIIGFLSFFVPGGLGVREGVMSASLSTLLPAPIAISIALLSRVWLSAAEILMYVSLPFIKPRKAPKD